MKGILKKVKESHNSALVLFGLMGLILNEILGMSFENTALRMMGDWLLNLL